MGLLDDHWFNPNLHPRQIEAQANKLLKGKKTRRGKRKKHKRKIPFMTYKQYMGSAYWRRRKNDYFGAHGKRCEVCGKRAGVTLHHKRYTNLKFGAEPDDALVALCGKHHHEFHENITFSANMTKSTNEYVETMKQVHNSNIDSLDWI